jgi:methyl-accepting chemotaxis protein
MQEQSAKLAHVVSVFKIDASSMPPRQPALARAPMRAAVLPRRPAAVAGPAAKPLAKPAARRETVATAEGDWEEF